MPLWTALIVPSCMYRVPVCHVCVPAPRLRPHPPNATPGVFANRWFRCPGSPRCLLTSCLAKTKKSCTPRSTRIPPPRHAAFRLDIHLKACMLLYADGIACLHVAVLPQLYAKRAGVHSYVGISSCSAASSSSSVSCSRSAARLAATTSDSLPGIGGSGTPR